MLCFCHVCVQAKAAPGILRMLAREAQGGSLRGRRVADLGAGTGCVAYRYSVRICAQAYVLSIVIV